MYILESHQSKYCKVEEIDWLIDWLSTDLHVHTAQEIFIYVGSGTITGEWLQNLGLSPALRAFEQWGIFIVPHQLWHGALVFPASFEGPSYSVASHDTRGDVENLF
jgi:hypothetical protein